MKQVLKLLILVVALVGCHQKNVDLPKKTLTLNLQEGNPPSLNPYVGVDLRSRCLFLALFEPLMRNNPDGKLEFAAAESVDINSSKTIYTFHLRDSKWSNGEPVCAEHYKNAWVHALTPKTHCVRADLFYPIKNAEKVKKGLLPLEKLKIDAPDSKTLVVELEHPTPYFLELTATSFFSPLYKLRSDDPVVFNGPFVLKEWVHDQKLVFEKNPNYWDRDAVELEEICFTMVKDPMTAYIMYENKELDLVGAPFSNLPLDLLPHLKERGELKSQEIARILYLLVNTTKAPLDSPLLRKALGLCIDRDQLVEHIFFGETPTLSPLPRPLALIDEEAFQLEDPKEVFEQALKELGMTRKTFPTLVFSYAELSGEKRLAEFLQSTWKEKLGIDVELSGMQWNTHIANIRSRTYDIGTLHLTTIYQDPMFYFDLFKERKSLCNYTGWEHPAFQEKLLCANLEIDQKMRKKILEEAEMQLYQQMPAISLYTQNFHYLLNDRIDLKILALGVYDFKNTKYKAGSCH